MTQAFLHAVVQGDQLRALQRKLEDAGFAVGPSGRNVGGLFIRVREDSADKAEVERIAAGIVPNIHWGPPGSPTRSIVDYRAGY